MFKSEGVLDLFRYQQHNGIGKEQIPSLLEDQEFRFKRKLGDEIAEMANIDIAFNPSKEMPIMVKYSCTFIFLSGDDLDSLMGDLASLLRCPSEKRDRFIHHIHRELCTGNNKYSRFLELY